MSILGTILSTKEINTDPTFYRRTGSDLQLYYTPPISGSAYGVFAHIANTIKCMFFTVNKTCTLDRIGINVTVAIAGSKVRMGIYQDGGNISPVGLAGNLIVDGGEITLTDMTTLLRAGSINSTTTPIQVTANGHGLTTGTMITISGTTGTGAVFVNNLFRITSTGANTFTLDGSVGVAATAVVVVGVAVVQVFRESTINTVLSPGILYWLCYSTNALNTVTVEVPAENGGALGYDPLQAMQGVTHFEVPFVFGAYPATFPSQISSNGITLLKLRMAFIAGTADSTVNSGTITVQNHGIVTGQVVIILGVTGTGAAALNGTWLATNIGANTFTLQGTTGIAASTVVLTAALIRVYDNYNAGGIPLVSVRLSA